jgi:multidrug efflux pump subunit AcrA (membrane-fusion protein)
MKRTIIITGIVIVLATIVLIVFNRMLSQKNTLALNLAEVRQGNFEIVVKGAGELVAENTLDIRGPNIVRNRNFRSGVIKILDIVPEGTVVKKGEYIASLDKTEFDNTLKNEFANLNEKVSELEMKVIDTAVTLSTLRDDIKDQAFLMEEAQIVVAQSIFEPPATQRQADLEADKAKRLFEWKSRLYYLRRAQSIMETRILKREVENQRKKVTDLEDILKEFTILAPADGMVMYKKDQTGVKRIAGSFINPFDPVVATLPDMSSMISKIFVSEIEVSKLEYGQNVEIVVDAFPEKFYTGQVISIANIGEQLLNSDSKLFEILVHINEYDPSLRPSMTTGNRVITKSFEDVIYVPIESVRAGADNIPYVYTRDGFKQIVVPGLANEKNIIIEEGLAEGTFVFLTPPENASKFELAGNELIETIRDKELAFK